MSSPARWDRPHFSDPAGEPFLFYVAFGRVRQPLSVSRETYHFEALAPGLDLSEYGPAVHPDRIASFRQGWAWDDFRAADPALAAVVAGQSHCCVLRGHYRDAVTLDDFRDAIGLLTCLLDSGCVALWDPQMLKWWSPAEWRQRAFAEGGALSPEPHVAILMSVDETAPGMQWCHTRGLRKFGRPDISVPRVPPQYVEPVIELCNRFIRFQALGGVIAERQEVRMSTLPDGMRCHHGGSLEDPEFNNVHVEVRWP